MTMDQLRSELYTVETFPALINSEAAPAIADSMLDNAGKPRAASKHEPVLPGTPAKPKPKASDDDLLKHATLDVFDVGDEDGAIEPRAWLLGNTFCRGFLSSLISAGAGGKTTLRILQLLALATGMNLTGEHVFLRCRVMIVCLEDDMKELRRRVRAAMIRYGIKPEDVKGYLFLTTPKMMKIAQYAGGNANHAVVAGGLYYALLTAIKTLNLDLVSIDPAVKAHGLKENVNDEIDVFATLLANLAQEKKIAVDLLSHERKSVGAEAGDANRQRGAGSLKDAGRLFYTLTKMSEGDAAKLGVSDEDRKFLTRIDAAKVNLAAPSTTTTWFKLIGVKLGNGNETYPEGDTVQTVELWQPPSLFAGLSEADLNKVLAKLAAELPNGQRYSTAPRATERAAWNAVKEQFPHLDEAHCRAIISKWHKSGLFIIDEYDDPITRKKSQAILGTKKIGLIDDVE